AEAGVTALLSRQDAGAVLALAQDAMDGLWWMLNAWAFAESARAALRVRWRDTAWADAKIARMRYGVDWLLPQAASHWNRILGGDLALPELDAAH
ncbi:MAG: acyl-CoA dehydrogenase, partial [Thiomonas sp.]